MRVSILLALAGSALFLAACSDAGISQIRRRADAETAAGTATKGNDPSRGGSNANPTPESPQPDPAPATPTPAPDGGAKPAEAGTPPAPTTCTTPKCFAFGGYAACKATDGAGREVSMGCENGGCACKGGSGASFNGDPASGNDAALLFLANCCK